MKFDIEVKRLAREHGFDLCGMARAEPVPGLSFFDLWLKRGLDGPLAYLKKHRGARADPNLVLPGVRSIICLGRVYPSSHDLPISPSPAVVRVASYALGEDYHVSLKRDLALLADKIKRDLIPDLEFRVITDSAPVLERSYAQAAGLGWIGKNTCLIHPEKGSFFLIGEILTTVELDGDEVRVEDQCGSCTACLDACPTGALVEPGVMDASRCISTLTLEQKGVLPADLMPKMENWIAGCDICQEVCPFNQGRQEGATRRWGDAEMRRAEATPSPSGRGEGEGEPRESMYPLKTLLSLSLGELKSLFLGSAVLRAKPAMLMRNALVAAGNSGDKSLAALVGGYTRDEDMAIREAALWAAERLEAE